MTAPNTDKNNWTVYMVRCADGSLYTGIAKSLSRRIEEHNSASTGAKYTRTRRPVKLVYFEYCESRSAASKREAVIKRLSKSEKEALIATENMDFQIDIRNIK